MMRFVRDVLLLIVLTAVGAGVVMYQRNQREEQETLMRAVSETRRLEMEVKFRAATKDAELNARGWPVTIDPAWFEKDPPTNTLVGYDRPWIEIASAEESELQHPSVRMTIEEDTAAFWYNPYQGVVRARVPVMVSDEQATALYNRVNEATLGSIFWIERPPARLASRTPEGAGHDGSQQDGKPEGDEKKDEDAGDEAATKGREPTRVIVTRTSPSAAKTTGKNTKPR